MAGMLPGVECARRRRVRQSGGWSESPAAAGQGLTRRSSFCLYASNNECHLSSSSSMKRSTGREGYQDEKLGEVAREAKERLDERLRAQGKSETKRNQTQESLRRRSTLAGTTTTTTSMALQTEVFGLKKSGSRRFNWAKLRWKPTDQDECAICLEQFKVGETLVNLPCAHRFHTKCLTPWLETNSQCPCCRMGI